MASKASSNRAIGYIRVSTADQAEHGISLEAQDARIRAYCAMRGLELAAVVSDPGVSASKPLAERDGGKRILEALKGRQVGHVVSLKLDRLFRNTVDCLTTIGAWDKAGIALHLIDMGGAAVDTSSAMGRMFLTMAAGFAEMERTLTAERTKSALARKSEKGETTGGIPYGLRLDADGVHLTDHPTEQAMIATVQQLRASGHSHRSIAAELTQQGLMNRAGGAFNHTQVARILARVA